MTSMREVLCCSSLIGLVLGCSPGGSDGPGEETDGTSSTGSTATSSDGSTTTGSTDTAAGCDQYLSEAAGQSVTVTFRNDLPYDVYLVEQYGCLDSWLSILDPSAQEVEWRTDGWILTCEELMGGNVACGGPGCTGSALRLTPGGTRTETWPGVVFETVEIDMACSDDDVCGPTCNIPRTPAPGDFTFAARAIDGLDCGGGACPECTPDADGACVLYLDAAQLAGNELDASTVAAYPAVTAVDVVFE